MEALFAGNNWDTGNTAAAYVESANSEDLLFIVYENGAATGATADAVIVRAVGDGAADSFAGEISVVGVFNGVAADAFTSADFIA